MAYMSEPTRTFPWERFSTWNDVLTFMTRPATALGLTYPKRFDDVRGGGGGGAVRPGSVRPGPLAQVVTSADQAAVNQLLRQTARGITASEAQLLEWQLLDRLRLNPSDDFARVMLGQVKRTAKRKVARKLAQKVAAKTVAYVVPGAGIVAAAADVVSLLGPVIVGSQKAAIDRLASGMTNKAGSQTVGQPRPRAAAPTRKPKPQPKRQLEVPTLQLPTQTLTRDRPLLVDPGKLQGPEPSVLVDAKPISLGENPLVNQATQPQPGPKPKPRPRPAPWPWSFGTGTPPGVQVQSPPGNQVQRPPGRKPAEQGSRRPGSSDELLRRFSESQRPEPLTSTQPGKGESGDNCKCKPGEKKQRKKRKPRSVCYRGTFTERANGLTKRKMEKVPCR